MFYKEKNKIEAVLENFCKNLVDVIYETFMTKYYIVRISQSKRGHISLIVRKKRGRLLYQEKKALHAKIFDNVMFLRGNVEGTSN